MFFFFFFFQAEDGIRDVAVTGVQTCALPISSALRKLITDSGWRHEVGGRGQQFAQANFRAERYASDFLAFLEEVKSAMPVLQYLDRMASHLRQMGVSREMVLVD